MSIMMIAVEDFAEPFAASSFCLGVLVPSQIATLLCRLSPFVDCARDFGFESNTARLGIPAMRRSRQA